MANIPPNLDITGKDAEEKAYKIAEILQLTLQNTATWCESLANTTWPNLEQGFRDEGMDGGGRLSQLLHGGDARKSARHIVQPLYVVQTDLRNAAQTVSVFGNRIRVEYFDAIRQARQAKQRSTRAIPVN
jgi:hypothetical protein